MKEEPLLKKISINNAQKSYKGNKALNNISFEIYENEIFGILGPNGAGKTTLIESVLGLRKLDYGEINVFGINAFSDHQEFVNLVGAQLQQAEMSPIIKVKEAVQLQAGLFGRSINIQEKLTEFQLEAKGNTYFSKLSGGEKQKLFILLSTIQNPEILFFDELTTGLDPVSRRETWSKIMQFKEIGKTVILSTHLMQEAEQICDRVALINHGNLISIGSTSELIKSLPFSNIIEFESPSSFADINRYINDVKGIFSIENPSVKQFIISGTNLIDSAEIKMELNKNNVGLYKLRTRECNLEDYFYYSIKKEG